MRKPTLKKIFTAALLATLLPAFFAPAAAQSGVVTPISGDSDRKTYRALQLANGMKVLLVSDPAGDKAAASLDVRVGSADDPRDWQGLAHLLEHMLFLGSEKYPEPGEYRAFISAHGGEDNAYVTFDHTNYYFEVSAAHLRPALERFSRFFIDPLFSAAFTERERSVVHSEFQSGRKTDGRRLLSARRQLLNRAHPASRFSVGSEHTLRDRDGVSVREKLLEFYRAHYSAGIMSLVIAGREELDQLEKWARELFREVPNRNVRAARFEMPYVTQRALRQDAATEKDEMRALFFWPVPGAREHYRAKPLHYIAALIGDEGEGSLLARLVELGWADALNAGHGHLDDAQGSFDVSIRLTEAGLKNVDAIGALLFAYIGLIARDGIAEWRHGESRQLARIAFHFAEEPGALATAVSLSPAMHHYAREDILRGRFMREQFRPKLIRKFLSHLRPENVLLQVSANSLPENAADAARTEFYDVAHRITPIPAATLQNWNAALRKSRDSHLALPAKNPFIPARLTPHTFNESPKSPRRLAGVDARIDAWHHPDAHFGTPRAAFFSSVLSPPAAAGAREHALTEIYARMVTKRLETPGYAARLAGMRYEIFAHQRGFGARISGYADRQPQLLREILRAIFAPDFDAARFAVTADALAREWRNRLLDTPFERSLNEVERLLVHPAWSEQELLDALAEIQLTDVEAHAARMLQNARITTLAHGDVTAARAREMNQMLVRAFGGGAGGEVTPPRVRKLGAQAYLQTLDVDHSDTALAVYFQGREKSVTARAKAALLGRMLQAPFFSQLRTENRVGYLVHALHYDILRVPGVLFIVQSSTHAPAQIKTLLDAFLTGFAQTIGAMSANEFAQTKQGLLDRILARDENLTARTRRNWREIHNKNFDFASRAQLADAIRALQKSDIAEYFTALMQNAPHQLLVQSPGRRDGAHAHALGGENYVRAEDALRFEDARKFFPAY